MKSDQIQNLISTAQSGYDYYKKFFLEAEDAFFMRMDPILKKYLEDNNMSNLYFPKINAKCKRITDSLSETYFNNDKFSKLSEYINSDPKVIEKWQEANDHYTELINLYKTFLPIFQEAPYIGTSIAKVYWSGKQCRIDKMSVEDVWFDPNARTDADVRYIVENIYMTKGDIKALQKSKIYSHKVDVDKTFNESKPSERFKLQEVYFLEDGKWKVTTVYNGSVFLRENIELRDGHPFVWGYLMPQMKSINENSTYVCCYGEPVINSIIPLQYEFNETRNRIIDGTRQHLQPKIIAARSAGISRADIETVGKPIFANSTAGITVVPPPNLVSAQQNVVAIDTDMSETVGVSPNQNGISGLKNQTATESSIMSNEGSVRMQGYIRTFNETFFEKVFERLAMLVWYYGDAMFFTGIDRTELPSYKVSLNTGIGALNKEVQKQGLTQAYQLIGQQFQMYASIQDQEGVTRMAKASEKVVKEILPLVGVKNVDEFLGEEHADNI